MIPAHEATIRLIDLLRRERHALGEFLVALAQFDRERLWEKRGHASLFAFLRRELGLSAGAAQYRKTAAELVQRYPAVEAALREGTLCLSSVIEVAKVITPENVAEVLPRFFGRSSRDAAFVAASIRPVANPPRRDFMVTPVRTAAAETPILDLPTSSLEASPQLRAPEMDGSAAAAPILPTAPATPALTDRPRIKPLDAERARVNMTVSRRLLAKLAAARDALSHSNPGASEEEILEVGLDLILQRHAKRRGLVAKPRKATRAPEAPALAAPAVGNRGGAGLGDDAEGVAGHASGVPASALPSSLSPPTKRSRYVSAHVAREVWKRDEGKCQWPVEGGGVCGATVRVQMDHIDGWALGGATTVERMRLLCAFHQDVHARKLYGNALMDRYSKPKGGGCSEPVAEYAAIPWTVDTWQRARPRGGPAARVRAACCTPTRSRPSARCLIPPGTPAPPRSRSPSAPRPLCAAAPASPWTTGARPAA